MPQSGGATTRLAGEARLAGQTRLAEADPRVPTTAETATLVAGPTVPRRRLGASGLGVFPIALSGKSFGWTADVIQTERILDRYLLAGGNLLDTADAYAGGRSEIMIGNWMRTRRIRDHLVVATKVGKGADHPGVTARAITAAVEDSLRRLGTDRIDVLYLHVDDPLVPFEQTLLGVDDLIRSGKVRHFGLSDHPADRLLEARVASAQAGVAPMTALQIQYHLLHRREYERAYERVARDLGLAVMPRFALAGGFLTGKYRTRSDLARAQRPSLGRYLNRTGLRVLATLEQISRQHGVSAGAVALAWLLSKPGVVTPVVSASGGEQIAELISGAELRLTRHQLAELDRVSG